VEQLVEALKARGGRTAASAAESLAAGAGR
jgi:hypothetical protein